jgi:hypothetical protein
MILDGRISRVQFETLAFLLQTFPVVMWFKRWFTYAPPSLVYLQARSTANVRLNTGTESGHHAADGTAKRPEPLCPSPELPRVGET